MLDNALFIRLISRAFQLRASTESIAFLEPYLIDKYAVWIIENVAQEAVIDPETVAEVGGREGSVADLTSEFRFKRMDGGRQHPLIEAVPHDEEVDLRIKDTDEDAREDDEPWRARALERGEDVLRAHARRIADEGVERRQVLETRIHLVPGGRTDSALAQEASGGEVSKLATHDLDRKLRPERYLSERKARILIEHEKPEHLEASGRTEDLCKRFHGCR